MMGTMISGTGDSGGCHIGVTSLISGTGGGGGCDTGVTFLYIALCRCQNASTGSVLEELSKRFRKSRMNSSVSRYFEHACDRVCWHSRRSESMYGQSEGSPGVIRAAFCRPLQAPCLRNFRNASGSSRMNSSVSKHSAQQWNRVCRIPVDLGPCMGSAKGLPGLIGAAFCSWVSRVREYIVGTTS